MSPNSTSCELHQCSRRMYVSVNSHKVDTRETNSGHHGCKADALPYEHGHHIALNMDQSKFFFI